MAELSPLEKYNQGIPLNEELAEMRAGVEKVNAEADSSAALRNDNQKSGWMGTDERDADAELTRTERLDLKELRVSRGWAVLMRLQEKTLHAHRRGAIHVSMGEPLGNAATVANAWAYVKAYQRAQQELPLVVDLELKQLSEGTK
jgi:hypothetical protein